MIESSPPASGQIFISYRRQETSHLAGRLYDRLANRFGAAQVFVDVDSIEPGMDFTESIVRAVGTSDVLLAFIGPQWLTVTDYEGQRRIDDPQDLVRLEINTALARDIRVIPVLVDGAPIPNQQSLPDDLSTLALRQAIPIRSGSFRPDTDYLMEVIEKAFSKRLNDVPVPEKQPWRHTRRTYELILGPFIGLVFGLVPFLAIVLTDRLTVESLLVGGLAGALTGSLAGELARRQALRHAWWVGAVVFGLTVGLAGILSGALGDYIILILALFGLAGGLAGALAGELARRQPPRHAWWVGALVFGPVFGSAGKLASLSVPSPFVMALFGLAVWVAAHRRSQPLDSR